jgi:hypothetical protein
MNEVMIKLEPHFLGAFLASEAACSILDIMPGTDLVEELRNLIYIQRELMVHIIEGKHYGSNNITNFVDYTQEVKDEMARLRRED